MADNREVRYKGQVVRCLKGMCGFIPAKGQERVETSRYLIKRFPFEDDYLKLCGENLFTIRRKQSAFKIAIGVFVPERAPWNGKYVSLVFKTLSGYADEYVISFPTGTGVPDLGTTVRSLLSMSVIPKTETMRRIDLACSRARALAHECITEELTEVGLNEGDNPKDVSMQYADWTTIASRVIDPKKKRVTKYFMMPLQPERGRLMVGKLVGELFNPQSEISMYWKIGEGLTGVFEDKGWTRVEKLEQLIDSARLAQLRHLYNEL